MKGIIARAAVEMIDRSSHMFETAPHGVICLRLAPKSKEDRERLLLLVEEAYKNGSWIEVGGGAGSMVEGVTIREVPALGPVVAEY